jgi:hypothetical protein
LVTLGPPHIPAATIQQTIAAKTAMLTLIDDLMDTERHAYDALDELLQTGDYGDFNESDIVEAKQRVHSAIQHERQSKRALQKSIHKLNDALTVLNWQAPPYIPPPQPHPDSSPKRQLQTVAKPALIAKPPRN